ncbi:MAG: hypothetical protein HRT72_00185 [Flavobacteriales bacterium]|nr:hypothetical protein [Flavobacteriales bacterium]
MKSKIQSLTSVILTFSILFLASCEKAETLPNTPPSLPTEGSFVLNMDNFSDITKSIEPKSKIATIAAGLTVLVWNTIMNVTLVVPVAAFKEAFNHEGKWDVDKDGYVWTYDVVSGSNTYACELVGSVADASSTNWEMYVSKSDGFQNVLWYEGTVANDHSSASWKMNKDGDDPTAYLEIGYSKTDENNATLKYKIVESTDYENSYIEYTISDDEMYDRNYDVYSSKEDVYVDIVWHSTEKYGSYTNSNSNEGNTFCWNELGEDTDCE